MKKYTIIIIVTLILAPLIFPIFTMSRINIEYQEINVKTGKIRFIYYIWFIKVRNEVKETFISTALGGEEINISAIKPWQRVNAFSTPIGMMSPHYKFHSAFSQIEQIGQVIDMLNADQFRRKEIAKKILTLWQEIGNDSGVNKYLHKLMDESMKKFRTSQSTGAYVASFIMLRVFEYTS